MTKRDFELIAGTITRLRTTVRTNYNSVRSILIDELAEEFANSLTSTNPRFNRQRFLDACGLDSDLVEEPTL
jgi:hypothetical protein